MATFADQTGRTIFLPKAPQRIVSLVPSQTELLYYLGLEKEVAGITKFCVYPSAWHQAKTKIGGTKNINPEHIRSLAPDLILANKEENVQAQVESLWSEIPVWVSDVADLGTALDMIKAVGNITDKAPQSSALIEAIENRFAQLKKRPVTLRTVYLIWREPYMTIGGGTFINDIMTHAGFENIFASHQRYPVVNVGQMKNCDVVFLSSEPYPFRQKHLEELQHHLPGVLIMLVDGSLFSWYGSRLLHAPAYLRQLQQQVQQQLRI